MPTPAGVEESQASNPTPEVADDRDAYLESVGKHPYEGWHGGAMNLQVYIFDLFKISQKSNNS